MKQVLALLLALALPAAAWAEDFEGTILDTNLAAYVSVDRDDLDYALLCLEKFDGEYEASASYAFISRDHVEVELELYDRVRGLDDVVYLEVRGAEAERLAEFLRGENE